MVAFVDAIEAPQPSPAAGALRRNLRDPRTWQIAALAALLVWNLTQLSLGAALAPSLVAISAALAAQIVAARLAHLPDLDLRSPLITGLSLALLLRGDALWVPAAAAGLAIASKFLLSPRRRIASRSRRSTS